MMAEVVLRVQIDREHDLAYIQLRPRAARTARTVHVTEDVIVDLDANDRLVGIELLHASLHLERDSKDPL